MMNVFIFISIMTVNIFFIGSSFLGYEYAGAGNSSIYIIYCVFIMCINLVYFLNLFLNRKINLSKKNILVIVGIPIFLFVNYCITMLINGSVTEFSSDYYLKYFILWSYTGIISGLVVAKTKRFDDVFKYIDFLILIGSISVLKIIIESDNITGLSGIGGATYQSLSYISAFLFGLNIYMYMNGSQYKRFKLFKGKIFKNFNLIMSMLMVCGVFISGGRGGIILVGVYVLYIIYSELKDGNKKKVFRISIITFIAVIIISISLPILLENYTFANGFNRVFQFIDPNGGINWDGVSGRDLVYGNALNIIKDNFLYGVGFFNMEINSHNIILDILLSGGIIYLSIVICFTIFIFSKLSKIIRKNKKYKIIIIILLYPLVMLMFSGSYTVSTEFWFGLSFVIFYNL